MALVGSVHRRKLDWISDKEDGLEDASTRYNPDQSSDNTHQVIEHKILITFLSEELQGPASDVSNSIRRALLSSDCRDAGQGLCLLSDAIEECSGGDVGDVMRNLEKAPRSSGLRMDDSLEGYVNTIHSDAKHCSSESSPLRYPFPRKMGQGFYQLRIFKENEASSAMAAADL